MLAGKVLKLVTRVREREEGRKEEREGEKVRGRGGESEREREKERGREREERERVGSRKVLHVKYYQEVSFILPALVFVCLGTHRHKCNTMHIFHVTFWST